MTRPDTTRQKEDAPFTAIAKILNVLGLAYVTLLARPQRAAGVPPPRRAGSSR